MTTATLPQERIAAPGRVWTIGIIAAVIAAMLNLIVYIIANALGVPFNITPPDMPPVPFAAAVVAASAIGVLVGTLVFSLMPRFTQRPVTMFRNVAIVALVLSFLQPLLLVSGMMPVGGPVTAGTIITLEIMHVVAGVVAIYLLTTRAVSPRA